MVLAASGCTSLYQRGSSRADENTGDAMALAWDTGAELQDTREDAPESRAEWVRTIVCHRASDGGMALRTEPVPPISSAVQQALDEHHALDYHHLE